MRQKGVAVGGTQCVALLKDQRVSAIKEEKSHQYS